MRLPSVPYCFTCVSFCGPTACFCVVHSRHISSMSNTQVRLEDTHITLDVDVKTSARGRNWIGSWSGARKHLCFGVNSTALVAVVRVFRMYYRRRQLHRLYDHCAYILCLRIFCRLQGSCGEWVPANRKTYVQWTLRVTQGKHNRLFVNSTNTRRCSCVLCVPGVNIG